MNDRAAENPTPPVSLSLRLHHSMWTPPETLFSFFSSLVRVHCSLSGLCRVPCHILFNRRKAEADEGGHWSRGVAFKVRPPPPPNWTRADDAWLRGTTPPYSRWRDYMYWGRHTQSYFVAKCNFITITLVHLAVNLHTFDHSANYTAGPLVSEMVLA